MPQREGVGVLMHHEKVMIQEFGNTGRPTLRSTARCSIRVWTGSRSRRAAQGTDIDRDVAFRRCLGTPNIGADRSPYYRNQLQARQRRQICTLRAAGPQPRGEPRDQEEDEPQAHDR